MGASAMGLAYAAQAVGSVSSSVSQASAIRQQADYQSTMAEQNARLATIKSQDASQRGEVAAQNAARENRQRVGAQRAAIAAQGVNANTGSAAAVQSSQEAVGALTEATIRNNAWREAWGYKVEAANDTAQSKFTKAAADSAVRNTLLTGGMQALSSLGKAGYAGKDLDFSDPFTTWDDGGTLRGRAY
jgi:hypothetical protein